MSGDQVEALPEELETWLEERASETGVNSDELLTRAVTAYRLVDEHGDVIDGRSRQPDEFDDELTRLDGRIDSLQSDLDEMIDDVRSRVVQVKHETDQKAARDHDHPGLEKRLNVAGATASKTRERLDRLDDRLDRGFENYEEILTHLQETTDDVEDKLTRLAQAVVTLRRRTDQMSTTVAEWQGVEDLKREANQQGVTAAKCEHCGSVVHLGLLGRHRCPHCDEPFVGLEPARGFFGSATLTVGDRPALDGQTTDETVRTPTELLTDELDDSTGTATDVTDATTGGGQDD